MLLTAIYVSILPIIIAATLSTIVVKLGVFRRLRVPIDNGYDAWDGRRVFGENKTWLGVAGLVLFGGVCMTVWGIACASIPQLAEYNWFYRSYDNTIGYNLLIGVIMGLAYATAELPNSFIKRRQGISAGDTVQGAKGVFNILIDHTDSIFGCALVMVFVCALSPREFLSIVIIGAVTHILVNIVLVLLKIKKNI